MPNGRTAILHYSAPPVVGGVESVIYAQAQVMVEAGYRVTVVAGRGEAGSLPAGTEFVRIPELDTQDPQIEAISKPLEAGLVPPEFSRMETIIRDKLEPVLRGCDRVIAHNVLTKHFNLPLTAALVNLVDAGAAGHCIAWCHDLTWTSPHSRSKVHPGSPWDLLRTYDPRITYVTVSRVRQQDLAGLFGCPLEKIHVVYNGIDPQSLLGLSKEGIRLVKSFQLFESDLNLLMPVRVTQAKNIEHAIQVTRELKAVAGKVRLVITGPPDPHDPGSMAYFRSLQDLRREAGVGEEVRFVAESGDAPEKLYTIGQEVVAQLYRVSDAVFIPSHREGFGMPVLEAGLSGLPVITTPIPAAVEIGGEDVVSFPAETPPNEAASLIWNRIAPDPAYRLRRRVRQGYTWTALFRREIEPLFNTDDR